MFSPWFSDLRPSFVQQYHVLLHNHSYLVHLKVLGPHLPIAEGSGLGRVRIFLQQSEIKFWIPGVNGLKEEGWDGRINCKKGGADSII